MSLNAFDQILGELKTLKAPGISGSRIKKLTEISITQVQEESQIVQKLYINCKSAPGTHKLGYLYVVDSIVRAYTDHARRVNDSSDVEGTFASGVQKVQALIPEIMDDAMESILSDDQRDKVRKLVDIWEKAGTFNSQVIASIRTKHFQSTTPKSEPPKPNGDGGNILEALAALANQPSTSSAASSQPSTSSLPPVAQVTNPSDPNAVFQMLQKMHNQMPVSQPQERANYRERRDDFSSMRRPRSRSPNRRPHSMGNNSAGMGNSGGGFVERNEPGNAHFRPKPVNFDYSLPQGSIKVLSRTIFIGGVPPHMGQHELATILRPFAEVQSIILNSERKHAFVKVYSRPEAERVLSDFVQEAPLRTRWGVGFGPRDCCDYQNGVSIIPISRLTDADRRWAVEAEWGGTNGAPLQSNHVIEEPDIEIGSGVSSKAISRKMPTNSTRNGPKSNRDDYPRQNDNFPSFMGGNMQNNPLGQLFNNAPYQQSSSPPMGQHMSPPMGQHMSPQMGQQMPQMGQQMPQMGQQMSPPMQGQQPQGSQNMNTLFQNLASLMNNQQQPR